MKKKLLYLSSLAVLSVSMVSCIDNDEPAGIKALREAKVNEINAIALKDSAEAVKTLAQAAEINASVVAQELVNAYNEVINANKIKVDNAKTDASVEKAKSDLEIAKLEAQLTIDNLNAQIKAGKYSNAELLMSAEGGYFMLVDQVLWEMYDYECDFIEAANDLKEAQQELLVAVNAAGKDSLNTRFTLTTEVSAKKYAYDMAGEAVVYAEKELADFQAIDKADHEAWGKLYNKIGDTIKAIDAKLTNLYQESYNLEDYATEIYSLYEYHKDLMDTASEIYEENSHFYKFTIPAEIADECKDWEFKDGDGEVVFFVNESGVLANEDEIANEELSDILESVLSDIDAKILSSSDANTTQQKLKELEAQTASYKKKYESDLNDFNTSVETYKQKAIKYQWSDVNNNSTWWEEMALAIESYNNDASKDDTKRKALSEKFSKFYAARYEFDAFESTAYYGTFNAKDMKDAGSNLTSEQLGYFDALMSYSAYDDLLGMEDDRYTSVDGAYGKYLVAAANLLGSASDRYEALSEEELDDLYENDDLTQYGSQGMYAKALRDAEKFGKDINNIDAWKSFYKAVNDVKEANDAKLKELSDNEHSSYVSLEKEQLFTEYTTLISKYLELEAKINYLEDRKTNKEALQNAVLAMTTFAAEENIESYEAALEYMEKSLARDIETAKEDVEEAKVALDKAEKDLADFVAGEYESLTDVLDAQEKVDEAQAEYNASKKSLDIIKAVYNDLLNSVK